MCLHATGWVNGPWNECGCVAWVPVLESCVMDQCIYTVVRVCVCESEREDTRERKESMETWINSFMVHWHEGCFQHWLDWMRRKLHQQQPPAQLQPPTLHSTSPTVLPDDILLVMPDVMVVVAHATPPLSFHGPFARPVTCKHIHVQLAIRSFIQTLPQAHAIIALH